MQRYLFTLLAVISLLAVAFCTQPVGVELRPNLWLVVPTLFGCMVLVCLFVERAIEVFLSALRGGGADALDRRLQECERCSDADGGQALVALRAERSAYRSDSRLIAQQMGLCFGLVIALLGLRILENLVVELPVGWQGRWFIVVDVFLTGSVLAGGSDAVNKLTKAYAQVVQRMAQKSGA